MKLKYYLRGVGIGIIVTTIIFMISIAIHKDDFVKQDKNVDIVTESTTVADIKKTDTENVDVEEKVEEKESDIKTETVTETETGNRTDELPHVETEVIKSEIVPEKTEKKNEKIRFQISGGEYSDVVCQKLVDEGLVDDAQKFNKYLIERDLDNFILPGIYEIPRDSTYEEIAVLLTTKVEKEQ